ncbi:MAG TPA: hypothetical protein VGG54_23985 [Trebonia sp.]
MADSASPEEEVTAAARRRAAAVPDEVSRNGREVSFRLRLTQTWVRTPAGWRCLAGHASQPSSS